MRLPAKHRRPQHTMKEIDSITGQSRNQGSGTLAKAHGSRSYSASNTTARLHVPGHYTSGNTMQQHSGRSGMAPPASRSRTNHGRHGAHRQRERRTAKHTQPTGGMSLPEDPISLGHALEYIPHAALIGKVSSECVACKGRQDNGLMPGDAPHKVADELKNYAGHRSKHAGSYYRQVHTSQQRILTQWWSEVLCVLELCHRHGATTWKDNAWTSPDGCVITHTTDLAALYNITVSTSPRRTKSFYDFALDRLQFARTNGSNYEVFVLRTGYTDQDRHGQAGPLLVRYADVFGLSKGSTITSFLGLNDRDAADLRRDLDVPDTDSEWEARKAWEDMGHHYLGSLDQSQLLDEEHCRHLHKPN